MAEGWLTHLWTWADQQLRSVSKAMKRWLRMVRVFAALLWIAVVVVLACAILAPIYPHLLPWLFMATAIVLVLPIVVYAAILMQVFRAKSLIRLVDKGYPANARELAIRIAARKMRDQSIATEELLVETAWNESKKVLRRYRERAREVREDLEGKNDQKPPPR